MPLNLKVHEYRKLPDSERVVLAQVNPYVCLCEKERLPVFVQAGQFFDQSGQLMKDKDVPEWALAQAAKLSDKIRQDVGLPPEEDDPPPDEDEDDEEEAA